jgi:hypothetical protein
MVGQPEVIPNQLRFQFAVIRPEVAISTYPVVERPTARKRRILAESTSDT